MILIFQEKRTKGAFPLSGDLDPSGFSQISQELEKIFNEVLSVLRV